MEPTVTHVSRLVHSVWRSMGTRHPRQRALATLGSGLVLAAVLARAADGRLPIASARLSGTDSLTASFDRGSASTEARVTFEARIESKTWAGSAVALEVALNGRTLGAERLVNSPTC